MKWYLAGPMTGIPQFNFPAFDAAAALLRERGYEVISPAEMDSEAVREISMASQNGDLSELEPTGETWGDILARDVKLIADECDGVAFLPGWGGSRGSKLEAYVGLLTGKEFALVVGGELEPLNGRAVLEMIYRNTKSA